MPSYVVIGTIVALTDLLIPITILSVWWALRRSRVKGPPAWQLAVPIVMALAWAALWVWLPALAAIRFLPPPFGQGSAIVAAVLALCALLLSERTRQFFVAAHPVPLVALGPWRAVYGLALLGIGLSGGLPPAFFWSAALGDIAVGLWSLLILLRQETVTEREIVGWNIIGLVDLLHVLALGAMTLSGFYLSDTAIAPLNLLPMAGVPVFMALHVLTLWGVWARRRAAASEVAA